MKSEALNSIESIVPQLAWQQMMEEALTQPAYKVLVGGGLIFSLGVTWRLLQQMYRIQEGERPQWIRPLVALCFYMFVLAHYEAIAFKTIQWVTSLGLTEQGISSIDAMFRQRNESLSASMGPQEEQQWFISIASHLNIVLLHLAADLGKIFAHAICIALRCLQVLLLAILVQTGPILIGVSFLGGRLAGLGLGWWMALIEVSAWSWVQDMTLRMFARLAAQLPESMPVVHEITMSFVIITALVSIPVVTTMLLRGEAASGIGRALAATTAAFALGHSKTAARVMPKQALGTTMRSAQRAHMRAQSFANMRRGRGVPGDV